MKNKYEVYTVGSDVYGISEHYDKDGKLTHHFAIYPARVVGAYIELNRKTNKSEIFYMLCTPKGEDWGAEVKAEHVNDSFDELAQYAKVIWDEYCNTM